MSTDKEFYKLLVWVCVSQHAKKSNSYVQQF